MPRKVCGKVLATRKEYDTTKELAMNHSRRG